MEKANKHDNDYRHDCWSIGNRIDFVGSTVYLKKGQVDEMKKLFISQPMNGKTDEEIKAERTDALLKATKQLDGESVELIDSFFENAPHDAKALWFLGKSLELLSTADVAYFAEGWENARGCRIEHECAVQYGIDRIE